jgi:hypothetical protein
MGGLALDAYDGIAPGRTVDVHALADVYARAAPGAPADRRPSYRAFDDRATGLALGLARASVAHAPGDGAFGFRADLGFGDLPNAYLDSDPGAVAAPGLSRALSWAEQAFVTFAPPDAHLMVDVGKFATPVGYEDNEAIDDWSYSRSLLFTLAEPTYHSGARATWSPEKDLALSAFWLNGWNANIVGGSGMRSFALASTWSPSKLVDLDATFYGGDERSVLVPTAPGRAFRWVANGTATIAPAKALAFVLAADYGHDDSRATGPGGSFWGVAGYAHLQVLPWLAASTRLESYRDPDGVTTGRAQGLVSATATVEGRTKVEGCDLIGRLEARRDRSDVRPFPDGATGQTDLTLAAIVRY